MPIILDGKPYSQIRLLGRKREATSSSEQVNAIQFHFKRPISRSSHVGMKQLDRTDETKLPPS